MIREIKKEREREGPEGGGGEGGGKGRGDEGNNKKCRRTKREAWGERFLVDPPWGPGCDESWARRRPWRWSRASRSPPSRRVRTLGWCWLFARFLRAALFQRRRTKGARCRASETANAVSRKRERTSEFRVRRRTLAWPMGSQVALALGTLGHRTRSHARWAGVSRWRGLLSRTSCQKTRITREHEHPSLVLSGVTLSVTVVAPPVGSFRWCCPRRGRRFQAGQRKRFNCCFENWFHS